MRVLLVDDHMDGLEITAKLLRMEGFEVVTAGCCQDAVALARQSHMDLVVTDLGLPDGTGMQLLSDLKQIYPIEGVAMTAHSEGQFLDGATRGGFARYLFKPFVFSDLLGAVREALGQEKSASSPGSLSPARA